LIVFYCGNNLIIVAKKVFGVLSSFITLSQNTSFSEIVKGSEKVRCDIKIKKQLHQKKIDRVNDIN